MMTKRIVSLGCLGLLCVFASPVFAQDDFKASPTKAEPTKALPIRDAKAVPKIRPLSVTLELMNGDTIEGTLTDTNELQMQTSFGTASVPLSEVAGVRFARADDATTTVVMLNGDSITGATDVKLFTLETEWGTASVNGQSISSIMLVPGLTWSPATGLNGKRWSLVDAKKSDEPPMPLPAKAASSTSSPPPIPSPPPQFDQFGRQIFPGR